jgi:hypothetical protein
MIVRQLGRIVREVLHLFSRLFVVNFCALEDARLLSAFKNCLLLQLWKLVAD